MTENDWGLDLTYQVGQKWDSIKDKFDLSNCGFSVFYSPIIENPELMILGFNPGGCSSSFNLEKALKIPQIHDYFNKESDAYNYNKYRLACRMRDLFCGEKLSQVLKASIKSNILFFRTPNKRSYNSIEPEIRKDLSEFCFSKVKEMINRLNPKTILFEGFETYDIAKENIFSSETEFTIQTVCKTPKNTNRLFFQGKNINRNIIVIPHPSSSRILNQTNIQAIKSFISSFYFCQI